MVVESVASSVALAQGYIEVCQAYLYRLFLISLLRAHSTTLRIRLEYRRLYESPYVSGLDGEAVTENEEEEKKK